MQKLAKNANSSTPYPRESLPPSAGELTASLAEDSKENSAQTSFTDFDESLESAFQLATQKGPMCAEPVYGMAFVVENVELKEMDGENINRHQATGALISTAADAFRNSMLDWSPRLALAMYNCDIQATCQL
jgi:ribosome assembly protein 1